jgi:hypothetical protein
MDGSNVRRVSRLCSKTGNIEFATFISLFRLPFVEQARMEDY